MRKRTFALLLAALILSSCGSGVAEETRESTGLVSAESEVSTETETEAETEPTATEIIKERYADTDLGGLTFTYVGLSASGNHIYSGRFNELTADELTGEVVNDSLFNRKIALEGLLNLSLNCQLEGGPSVVSRVVHKSATAGDNAYDLSLNAVSVLGSDTLKGDYLNTQNITTLHLSDRWWDVDEIETFTFDNRLYWLCGDVNIGDDYATQVLFFNKDLLKSYNFELPYERVKNGTWTIDVLREQALATKLDLNGDGVYDLTDQWGLLEVNDHIKHWLYPLGQRMVTSDGEHLVLHVQDEALFNVVEYLFRFFCVDKVGSPEAPNLDCAAFTEGRCLYYSAQLFFLELLRDMEDEFGIVPLPKYTEAQPSYGAYISHGGATGVGIPVTAADPETSGMVLDALAALSTDTLHSAFYDVLFSTKYVRDAESVEMLDLTFAAKSWDWAVDFAWSPMGSIYQSMIERGSFTYASDIEAKMSKIESKFAQLESDLRALPQ